jgi:hypothetical protein
LFRQSAVPIGATATISREEAYRYSPAQHWELHAAHCYREVRATSAMAVVGEGEANTGSAI